MADTHLSNDEFFSQLSSLFTARQGKNHSSIHMTQKRLTYGPTATDTPPILVRVTDGKSKPRRQAAAKAGTPGKVKLSTVVAAAALDAFFARYADVCKAGMTALKKRDRSKRKKKAKKGGAAAAAAA